MFFSALRWRAGLPLLIALPLLGASECNTFSGSANKTSDAALMFSAQTQINAQDYSDAITTLSGLSATAAASHDGITILASAHAGACGLNLVNFASGIETKMSGSSPQSLMAVLATAMATATSATDCATAQTLMLSIPAAEVTVDDDIFLAFISLADIGAVLVTAPGAESGACSTTNISNASVEAIGASLNIAAAALTAANISSIGSSITTAVKPLCTSDATVCSITTAGGFSAGQVQILRTAINTIEIGLNTCPGSFTNLACACPNTGT